MWITEAARNTGAVSVSRASGWPGGVDADQRRRVGRQRRGEVRRAGEQRGGVHVGAHAEHEHVDRQHRGDPLADRVEHGSSRAPTGW